MDAPSLRSCGSRLPPQRCAARARIAPRLVVAIAGEDAASIAYVQSLSREGDKVGVDVTVDAVDATAGTTNVRALLERLGADAAVHGIILQQPLPRHLDIRRIADAMPPDKDVDAPIRSMGGGWPSAAARNSSRPRRPP